MSITIWSSLFLISIAQGIFIIFLLFRKGRSNISAWLLAALLFLMVITNLDFYSVSSGLFRRFPHFFGISIGLMFLFGPFLYFYTQSLTDSRFKWKNWYLLHFVPYLANLLMNIPFYFTNGNLKSSFIEYYTDFGISLRSQDKISISLQTIHLFIYLFFTMKLMKESQLRFGNIPYITSITNRIKWGKTVFSALALFASVVFILLIYVLIKKTLYPQINYAYTLITSAIIYYIAYKAILNPELVNPDFQKKYKTSGAISNGLAENYIMQLEDLMNNQKIYLDGDLKLETLAKQMNLHQNQLSRLINEKYSKTYSDLINEYRIKEFIAKIQSNEHENYNIYGLAIEVGFNSKSSFNTAFKKLTGKTPTEFKKAINKRL